MSGLLESMSAKAASLGAVEISGAFAKENLRRLKIVSAAPFEPTLDSDTIIYADRENGRYYKLVRPRK